MTETYASANATGTRLPPKPSAVVGNDGSASNLRRGEMFAAVPTTGQTRPRRSTPRIGFEGKRAFPKRGSLRTTREMAPHLAGRELGAAAPTARHPWPRRSPIEVNGLRVELPNL